MRMQPKLVPIRFEGTMTEPKYQLTLEDIKPLRLGLGACPGSPISQRAMHLFLSSRTPSQMKSGRFGADSPYRLG